MPNETSIEHLVRACFVLVRQIIVFGDSTSDTGRRFNAPASFEFDDIGPFPWAYLFEEPSGDVSERAINKIECLSRSTTFRTKVC